MRRNIKAADRSRRNHGVKFGQRREPGLHDATDAGSGNTGGNSGNAKVWLDGRQCGDAHTVPYYGGNIKSDGRRIRLQLWECRDGHAPARNGRDIQVSIDRRRLGGSCDMDANTRRFDDRGS